MKIANNDNFRSVVSSEKPVVVDFWAEWCGPCRMLIPIMEELSNDFEGIVDICKCNVDECPEIASNFNIRSIPTLILFKNGEIIDISTGAFSKAVVKKWIESKI